MILKTVALLTCIIATNAKYERVVNIIVRQGEEIDNSYIEPNYGVDYRSTSVPGCPKSIDGNPWLYDGKPGRCYLTGRRGPCKSSHYFAVKNGYHIGVCLRKPSSTEINRKIFTCELDDKLYSYYTKKCVNVIEL